ncbi:hypothetical protein BD289DRAFT_373053 [Coniella lustricola]|uniref:Uncharacterized protein n=1 Tax=Coniella lustricola TaxID=2025994 RepID=A0A2T3A1I5_9PEZI|nr:hypothetical protein BD289DRAFT_373053 [Coniella lustricola]
MPAGSYQPHPHSLLVLPFSCALFTQLVATAASPSESVERRNYNPLDIDWDPAPPADEGPPGAANAIRNPAYLPAQIGGIVGSYAFSLIIVAILLLVLSKRRRERLRGAAELEGWQETWYNPAFADPDSAIRPQKEVDWDAAKVRISRLLPSSPIHGHIRNFSLPSPTATQFQDPFAPSPSSYLVPSPTSTNRGTPGVDPDVDQQIVRKDRVMAQTQLEHMYKYVMEQEEAKEAGVEFRPPELPLPAQYQQQHQQQQWASSSAASSKKEKSRPANLNLGKTEKKESRTSSIFSALKSPRRKKQSQPMEISSPIMTPMSGRFPQYVGEEMNVIPPRQYAPAKPPPIPTGQLPFRNGAHVAPLTPPDDLSPESTQSIDGRIGARHGPSNATHFRHGSSATTDADPVSAVSESSQSGLIQKPQYTSGLPLSPKPGVNRFPTLPSSPKPGASFSRPNAPPAVRTGGALPLRAYEPALVSPNTYDRTVKQTVFERAGPMSPGGMHTARTPMTANPVPYSPYQPFSPVVPMTPSLVTREDRKRMRKMEPKTPTLAMVKSDDELW